MRDTIKVNYTKDRETIANFLGCRLEDMPIKTAEYWEEEYRKDCPYPIKTSPLIIISSIVIFLICCASFYLLSLVDWLALSICTAAIILCYILFYKVRNVEYPNEQYNMVPICLSGLVCMGIMVFAYIAKLHAVSSLYYWLETSGFIYDSIVVPVNYFMIGVLVISLVLLIYGIICCKRRFGSMITPLIILAGFFLFILITNLGLVSDFVIAVAEDGQEVKTIPLYVVLAGAIIATAVFDLFFIYLSKFVGGRNKQRKNRYEI